MVKPPYLQHIPEGLALVERVFYHRPAEDVAWDLLGKLLFRRDPEGAILMRILETEAYLGVEDPACHTYQGRRSARVRSMWGDKGHAYIYLIYGIHHCLNAVCGLKNEAAAVLIRGGQVLEGERLVRQRRNRVRDSRRLSNGPGKLCQALALTREMDGVDLCISTSPLCVLDDGFRVDSDGVERGPRVGIQYAGEAAAWPLRFTLT